MDWKRSVSGHFVPPRATERLENLTEPASDFDSTFDSGVEIHKSQRSAASEKWGRAARRHGRESNFELFQIQFPFSSGGADQPSLADTSSSIGSRRNGGRDSNSISFVFRFSSRLKFAGLTVINAAPAAC